MSDQPDALYLADVIEHDPQSKAHHDAAASCLRRQHAEIAALKAELDALRADAERYLWRGGGSMTQDSYDYAAQADIHSFIKPFPVVGYWIFPGSTAAWATKVSVGSKPSRLHRWTMRILLGFKWEDV